MHKLLFLIFNMFFSDFNQVIFDMDSVAFVVDLFIYLKSQQTKLYLFLFAF